MAFPEALLSKGERIVLHKHPHWKALVLPTVSFVLTIAVASFLFVWIHRSWDDSGFTTHLWWNIAVVVLALIALIVFSLVPFLRWQTEHFVLTTSHVFFRTGIVHRRQHQIPLIRVQNIETIVTFWGRVLGFGTLIVDSAADEPLEFGNVASLTQVQGILNQLIADDRRQAHEPETGSDAPATWQP